MRERLGCLTTHLEKGKLQRQLVHQWELIVQDVLEDLLCIIIGHLGERSPGGVVEAAEHGLLISEAEGGAEDNPETEDSRDTDQPCRRAADGLLAEAVTSESIRDWKLGGIFVERIPDNAGLLEKCIKDEIHQGDDGG